MADTTITLPLDQATADAYTTASQADQQKMALLVRVVLQRFTAPSLDSLQVLMGTISTQAEERGLTPELLETLLRDDE